MSAHLPPNDPLAPPPIRTQDAVPEANALNDRVAYCVVKRNCSGPSIRTERYEGRTGITERWACRRCGGFVFTPDRRTPPKPHKIEP